MRAASEKSGGSRRRTSVSVIREVYFSLREVEAYICAFEEKYKMSSAEFLRNTNPNIEVSEDDAFEWEAFIAQRRELQSLDRQVHREYLNALKRNPHKMRKATDFQQAYAA
jgi:hypothetical protein